MSAYIRSVTGDDATTATGVAFAETSFSVMRDARTRRRCRGGGGERLGNAGFIRYRRDLSIAILCDRS